MFSKLGKKLKIYSIIMIGIVVLLFVSGAIYFGLNFAQGYTLDIIKENTIIGQATYFTPMVCCILGAILSCVVFIPLIAVSDVLLAVDAIVKKNDDVQSTFVNVESATCDSSELHKSEINYEKINEKINMLKQEDVNTVSDKEPSEEALYAVETNTTLENETTNNSAKQELIENVEEAKSFEHDNTEELAEENHKQEVDNSLEALNELLEKSPPKKLDESLRAFFEKFNVTDEQIKQVYKLIKKLEISSDAIIVFTDKGKGEFVKSKLPFSTFEQVYTTKEELSAALELFPNLEEVILKLNWG